MEERPFEDIFEHFDDIENSLGTGSRATRVYRGLFQSRPIAIKRVVRDLTKKVEREILIMLQTDRHRNILRYFAKEETKDFIFIGTELCEYNLAKFVEDQDKRKNMATKTIFQQTADGLNHLHKLSISEYSHFSLVSISNHKFQFIVTSSLKIF